MANMSAKTQTGRNGVSPRLAILAGVLAIAIGAATVQWLRRPPLLPVALPANAAGLDPQVRAHIDGTVAIVRADPRDAAKRATLGIAYAANGLWEESRRTFLDAATLAPDEPLARMYAAIALEEMSDEAGAVREFRALTASFPGFAPAWYRLGEGSMRVGDVAGAEAAYKRLSELAPGEWRGPAGLGEVRLRQGQPAAAIPWLEQALRIDRTARPAQFLLGQAYRAVGRTNEARLALALGAGVARHPMPDPWSNQAPRHMKSLPDQLAQADELSAGGRPDLAVRLLRDALPFHPGHPGLHNQLAVALNRAGRPGEAVALLDPLLRDDPKAVTPRITRSYSHVLLGHPELGLADAERAAALAPDTAQAHLAVANALLARDRDADAVAALRAALRCDARNAEIHVELGDVLWRNLGDKAAAAVHFEQAIELNPTLAKALGHLGLLQRDLGNPAAARATLATLQSVAPGSPEFVELRQALAAP